jgi:hypothetical protein
MSNKRSLLLSMISMFFVLVIACLALIRFYPYSFNFTALPRITHTQAGADGDPVNLVFVGTKAQILHSFHQASYDHGIEFSGTTHLPTHHIAPTVDLERNAVGADLARTGLVKKEAYAAFTPPIFFARNGGGDYYASDGDVLVINLTTALIPLQKTAGIIDELKHGVFSFCDTLLTSLLLAVAVGVLFLILAVAWLWLALSWLLKK